MEEQEPDPSSYHQRNVLISALALTAICTQLVTVMSVQPASGSGFIEKEKARWNDDETAKLVEYLWEHRAEGGDGGTFKNPTFHAAAQYIAEYRTSGPIKTVKNLQTKWSAVSCSRSTTGITNIITIAQIHLSSYHHIPRHDIWNPLGQ
jgi:hypothetical protein